uniref:3-carboxymuconate cyclase n=1 Tax=Ganoderma boninense TaxID=34458 RepID=A0A5K1JUR7_9APHY|nr:Uncharacterized protein [Ganoderma boninense]
MKVFSALPVVAVLSAISLVYAAPLQRRAGVGNKKKMAETTSFDTSGAVYFLTNEPDVNQILVATINVDGTLNLDSAVEAGGRGSHGKSNGPDALFSQGSIKASKKGRVLAAVNAGSNTISLFSIDPTDPTNLTPLGDPVSSEGEFPVSLAFNADGTRVCVLNGGAVSGVNCFKVDKNLGPVAIANSLRLLTDTDALKGTQTPPAGPTNTVSQVLFSEDGKQLIASVKGTPQAPGFFAIWNVAADGSLSKDFQKVAPPKGGALPFGMSVIPGKNALLATDPALGFDILDLSSGNKRSSANKITGQAATCWSAFSPKTGNFYLSDVGTSAITEVHVDNNLKATLVMFPGLGGSATLDLDVATINGRDFLYVLAANTTSVDVLAIDSPDTATQLTALNFAGIAKTAGVTVNTNNLQGMTTFTP